MAGYLRSTQRYAVRPGSFAYYALGSGAILNLSLGGVFIEDRSHSFQEGQEIELELRLQEEAIVVRSEVCHCRPRVGFGVRFLEFPEEAKQRLVDYFRTHYGRSD